jgi:NADH dehydrogenase FAD-containing subunit
MCGGPSDRLRRIEGPVTRSESVRFSGLLAWLIWRGIYLSKLPGIERKIRVLMDWTFLDRIWVKLFSESK